MKKSYLIPAILILNLMRVPAEAETTKPVMEEVVVTASRQPQEVAAVPANITVLTEEEIASSAAPNVPELLREAGLHVNDITGNRRTYTVDLRGFGETAALNTLVLVDGRRVNQADLSGADWVLIPKDRIQRIEIIRGGRGALFYGDNAAGGVVNIITWKGEGQPVDVSVSYGSYDSFSSSASINQQMDAVGFSLHGAYNRSDGYRDNSATESKDAGLNLEYFATDRLSLQLNSGYHKDETRLPGAILESDFAQGVDRTASLHLDDFSNTEDAYVQLSPTLEFATNSSLVFDASARNRQVNSFASFGAGSFEAQTEIDTYAFSPQLIYGEPLMGLKQTLTLGFDYNEAKEKLHNMSVFIGAPSSASFRLSKINRSVFAYEEVRPTEKLRLSAGIRNDHAKFKFNPGESAVLLDEELFDAGVVYDFSQKSSAYVSYGKSFRYPVLDELFNFFDNTVDTNLQPQLADDYEAGLRQRFGDKYEVNLNVFRIKTEQEIFFNPIAFSNQNLDGDTVRQGLEFHFAADFDRLRLSGNYVYTDARIDGGMFDDKDIPNVPHHRFSGTMALKLGKGFSVDLTGIYVGERPFISDFANTKGDQEDYFVANARLAYAWKKVEVFLALQNLLNEEYSEYAGIDFMGERGFYPSPKFNFHLGTVVHF